MNQLSWFIYLSDILGNFQIGLNVVGWGFICALLLWSFVRIIDEDARDAPMRPRWYGWVIGVACASIAMALPGKDTMRLMAASEFGERVINSERVQGIVDPGLKYVEKWLKDQLAEKKKD
jgi:hypothetical protein